MTLTFSDVLQPAQIKQHIPVSFDVPAGSKGIEIRFEYEPGQVDGRDNLLTLTVLDPQRARGEGHRHDVNQRTVIAPAVATPGYLAGEIPPGTWTIVINTHMILAPVTYRLKVTFPADVPEAAAAYTPGRTVPRGAGWYRGDLHGHTFHSDGHWEVPDLVAYARKQRLDFITLTDHNTMAGLAQMDSLASDDLLTMGGLELTTFYGHAVVDGIRTPLDWRVKAGQRTMAAICQEASNLGGLFIIAHPMAMGDPICTGCDWQYLDVMPGQARCVEIWNTTWDSVTSRNQQALNLWYRWLNEGFRMVATTGSDIHGDEPHDTLYGRNVVYADDLNERAILNAVRQGHLYLSTGARLELRATTPAGDSGMMGDWLPGTAAHLTVTWADVPANSRLRWMVNGDVFSEQECSDSGSAELTFGGTWALAELRDAHNDMLAVTNPVFVGDGWI